MSMDASSCGGLIALRAFVVFIDWRGGLRCSVRALQKGLRMRRLVCCAMVAGGLLAAAGPALAASSSDPDFGLRPVQGSSWQPFAGLADDPLAFGLTRRVSSVGDADLADVTGAPGLPTSSVTRLSLAVGPLPGGINPCWTVGFTGPDGTQRTVSLEASTDARGVTATPLAGGWTQWTWTVALPQGTLDQISLGVDVAQQPPSVGDQVRFDEIAINAQRFDGPISSLLGPVF
jgi:hypothetical protein